eukprot:scaffold203462_cov55-Attheya_sp.AAC.2
MGRVCASYPLKEGVPRKLRSATAPLPSPIRWQTGGGNAGIRKHSIASSQRNWRRRQASKTHVAAFLVPVRVRENNARSESDAPDAVNNT